MSFFKTVFATVIGFFLAFFFFFVFLMIISLGSGDTSAPFVSKTSVLTLDVSGTVYDRVPNDPFSDLASTPTMAGLSLEAVHEGLEKAAGDERIKAVWLKTGMVSGSWGVLGEMRRSIQAFRDSTGKPVYASAADVGMNEASWYLVSVADSIFAPSEALFEADGFVIESFFLKGMFDKVGIEPEIMRYGRYKSAVEPYIATEYSADNKTQLRPLVGIAAEEYVQAAAEMTGLPPHRIDSLLNAEPRMTMQFALNTGMVHASLYPEQVAERLRDRIGDTGKLNTISLEKYLLASVPDATETPEAAGKVAVLYLNGIILPEVSEDFGDAAGISYEWFARQADAIEKDRSVKAVVLRIDSPGGSGSTSDLIWNRINKMREKLPVVASIADVAASGGYYIAMAADTVFAYPSSITGSIGVFSTKINAKKMLNEQLGITFDAIKSHEHADWYSPVKPLTPVQRVAFQRMQDSFYGVFIQRVAVSRGMDNAAVDSVGQGRVWTGRDAIQAGLVDATGGFTDAVAAAAQRAGLERYETEVFPKRKTFIDVLLSGEFDQLQARVLHSWVPVSEADQTLQYLSFLMKNQRHLNAFMPFSPVVR